MLHKIKDINEYILKIKCLKNNIIPFYIEERNKSFYIRGLKEYTLNNEKGYLTDTCLNSQDNYKKLAEYFLND